MLDAADETLRVPRESKGIDRNPSVASEVRGLPWGLGSSWDVPTPAELRRIDEAETKLNEALAGLEEALSGEAWRALEAAFASSGLRLLDPGDPIE